jgi:APA family basic amino acid/polyamine antiporter
VKPESAELVRALGLWDAVALIMGIMIGSGIFLMAGAIARELDSLPAVVAVWAFGGLLSVSGAVALSELGAALPSAGGLYVYLTRAYGPGVGFVYGWSAMALIHAGGLATLAAAIGLYLGPVLGLSPGETKVLRLGVIALFALVNSVGVVVGKWVQNGLTALKVVGLAAMTAVLYASGSAERLLATWSRPGAGLSATAFGLALVAVLWAYDGWHFVSFAAGEIRDPARTIPRSLFIGTGLTCAIYLLVNVSYYAVLSPASLRGTDRAAAEAVGAVTGPGAALALSLLISVSILGAINGILLGSARVILAMARDGLFFRSFARVAPRFRTPVVATVAQAAWAAAFTLVGTFQQLFTSYVFTAWIFYGLAVAGVVVLRRREPNLSRPYRCPWYPLPIVFFLLATAGIVGSTFVATPRQALLGVGLILLGVPLYFVFRALDRAPAAAADAR